MNQLLVNVCLLVVSGSLRNKWVQVADHIEVAHPVVFSQITIVNIGIFAKIIHSKCADHVGVDSV